MFAGKVSSCEHHLEVRENKKQKDHYLVEQHNGSNARNEGNEGNERIYLRIRTDAGTRIRARARTRTYRRNLITVQRNKTPHT